MEAKECITARRSVRRYKKQPVSEAVLQDVVAGAAYAPSWKNTQTTRYTAVMDEKIKEKIAKECMLGFEMNSRTAIQAPVLIVVSTIEKRSGYERDGSFSTSKGTHWQSFDAGAAVQTLCLSAYEQGLGTVIMGIFDDKKIAEMIKLPEGESVSALVAMGYPDENVEAPKRKEVDVLLRCITE